VHACRFVLAGLLALHAEIAPAATANAPLTVSATVSSVCAISSTPFGGRGRAPAAESDLARINCAPTAAYAVSLNPLGRDTVGPRTVEARASTLLAQPKLRRDDVLIVEISY